MKNKLFLLLPLVVIAVMSVAYFTWGSFERDKGFECRARVYTKLIANTCNKSSALDIFLSMHGDGKGYLLVSGTHSCPKTVLVELDSVINFTYSRTGGYYSIHLGQRSSAIMEFFDILKYDDLKIKVTKVDNDDYIISSPIETIMTCTAE